MGQEVDRIPFDSFFLQYRPFLPYKQIIVIGIMCRNRGKVGNYFSGNIVVLC